MNFFIYERFVKVYLLHSSAQSMFMTKVEVFVEGKEIRIISGLAQLRSFLKDGSG